MNFTQVQDFHLLKKKSVVVFSHLWEGCPPPLSAYSISVLMSLCVYSYLYQPAAICMYAARVQILLSHPPLGRKMVMMANRELTASRAQPPEQSTALVWGTQTQNNFILTPFFFTESRPNTTLTLTQSHIFTARSKFFFSGRLCTWLPSCQKVLIHYYI